MTQLPDALTVAYMSGLHEGRKQAKRVPMTCQEANAAWSLYVSNEHFTHEDLVRFVEAHHGITQADKPTGDESEDLYALALKADNWSQP